MFTIDVTTRFIEMSVYEYFLKCLDLILRFQFIFVILHTILAEYFSEVWILK